MPCPRCHGTGSCEPRDDNRAPAGPRRLRAKAKTGSSEAARTDRKEPLLCTCDAGLAARYSLLTREQIAERGLDAETWRLHGAPPTKAKCPWGSWRHRREEPSPHRLTSLRHEVRPILSPPH
jgi:hypothetical protein